MNRNHVFFSSRPESPFQRRDEELSDLDGALRGCDRSEMDRLLHTSQEHRVGNHYAENQIGLAESAVIEVTGAEYISGYKLKLRFSDGFERNLDFEPFLTRSTNPMIRAYLEPGKFANFRLEHGNLVWDDYGLCFPIADLYENKI